MITFTDEILDKIHIPLEFRIKKPGIDKQKGDELNEIIWKGIGGFSKLKFNSHLNKRKKKKMTAILANDKRKYTKVKMQAKNQGH